MTFKPVLLAAVAAAPLAIILIARSGDTGDDNGDQIGNSVGNSYTYGKVQECNNHIGSGNVGGAGSERNEVDVRGRHVSCVQDNSGNNTVDRSGYDSDDD